MFLRPQRVSWRSMLCNSATPSFVKHPYANPATTFYKRELPPNCVSFAGKEGRQLFGEALAAGTLECYFALAEQFRTQSEPAYCGLGSLVMALNTLGTDPQRVWKVRKLSLCSIAAADRDWCQGPWRWIDEEMLDCCSPLEVIAQQGITMAEFSCLASCNGASVVTKFGSAYTEDDLRRDVREAAVQENGVVMVVSYDRSTVGQTGSGHFSPIGGYLASRDMVLVMDVARFKYPPHWLRLSELYSAMQPHDPVTGKSRGWHLLTRRKERLSFLHFPGHITSALWYELVEMVRTAAASNSAERLLQCLVGLSEDPRFAEVFPQLVAGATDERWHFVQRVRALEVFGRLPAAMADERKLVVALLYEALWAACAPAAALEAAPYAQDKPFRAELQATRNVISTTQSFCDNCHCERASNAPISS